MKKFLVFALLIAGPGIFAQTLPTQRICGTPVLPNQFENWLRSVTPSTTTSRYSSSSIQSVFNIPVIVHIIHNNEAVNLTTSTSGNNISAAQVIDQINILNEDFKGLNADTSLIPTVFKPALGKMQVNFCLAVVNPTGGILAEPGIDRINRVTKGWSSSPYSMTYIDATIKPNSIWDVNKYFNIWVCGLTGGVLGYATFPNPGTSGLSGLNPPYGSTTSDGIVILNTSFGSIGTAQFGNYNQGRTATHEVGHWMGLRHIWGDGTCATDYVTDTPPAQTANYGCPNFPYKLGVCTGNTTGEMTMNYMDYTDDACLYMFTKDQKMRAQLILVNSPIRAALLTSTVCNLPSIGHDIGISYVSRPTYSQNINCNNYIDPIINLTNYGSTTLTSFVVTYNIDNNTAQSFTWTGTANPGATFTLAIPQISGLSSGAHTFSVSVASPNGSTDNNLLNNSNMQNFSISNVLNVTVTSATTCAGMAAVLSASGAVNYTWSVGGNSSTVSITPSVTGVYSVSASNSICTVVRTTTLFVNPGPTITVNNATVCSGTPALLNASGANSFTWNTGATTSSLSISPFTASIYTVTGTNSLGCTSAKTATVFMLTSPTVAVNNLTICSGGTATLSASGANSYSWSTGGNTSVILVTPGSTTIYTVTGTIGTCVETVTASVTIGTELSVFISKSSPSVCSGASATISASGANSYTWNTGSNNSSIVVNPTLTTLYSVSGAAGTCPGSNAITLFVNALPITSVNAVNVSCFGGSDGQLIPTSTGNGPFTYAYPNGSVNLVVGTYSVLTTDIYGCVTSNVNTLSQPPALVSTVNSNSTTCPSECNGSASMSMSGGVGPYTYTLFPGNLFGGNISNLCAGTYTYYSRDNSGCLHAASFSVIPGNLGLNITSTVTHVSCGSCADATISAGASNGTGPYTYTWMPGNYNTQTVDNVGIGCYEITIRDAKGCSSVDTACVSFDVGIRLNATNKAGVRLIPNPNNGLFLIEMPFVGSKTVEIFDARGRLVSTATTVSNIMPVDISNFASGFYYARVLTADSFEVIKLVKE